MNRVSRCACCGGEALRRWPALVAPFIAEYVLRAPPETCALLECERCGFRFFDRTYDEDELHRLYAHYRGRAYFESRHRHEPWYTERFNAGFGHDARYIEARRSQIHDVVGRCAELATLRTVLDYGGDSGQIIPAEIGREKRHVYDLSDAAPVEGVVKVTNERDLARYDLVILTGVLEHSSDPEALLRRVAGFSRGLLYIEVPHERFDVTMLGRGRAYERYLRGLVRHPRLLRWVDFYASAFRVKLGVLPPLGFVKLHEHIGFFDERSLSSLVARAGLRMKLCETRPVAGMPTIACVAALS
jgi:hypothetical protein